MDEYVIYEATIKEIAENNGEKLYEINNDSISGEQLRAQREGQYSSWNIAHAGITFNERELMTAAKRMLYTVLQPDVEVKKAIYEKMFNSVITVVYTPQIANIRYYFKDDMTDDVSYDVEKLGRALATTYVTRGFANQHKYIVETISITTPRYYWDDIGNRIMSVVNKLVKKELTYCLYKEKCIVPQEYIDQGESGIKAWRELKSKQNKNNSMEKQLLKTSIREQKTKFGDALDTAYKFMTNPLRQPWDMPQLEVQGRWNQQKNRKLISQLLHNKTNKEILALTDEDIKKMVLGYWTNVLDTAKSRLEEQMK